MAGYLRWSSARNWMPSTTGICTSMMQRSMACSWRMRRALPALRAVKICHSPLLHLPMDRSIISRNWTLSSMKRIFFRLGASSGMMVYLEWSGLVHQGLHFLGSLHIAGLRRPVQMIEGERRGAAHPFVLVVQGVDQRGDNA